MTAKFRSKNIADLFVVAAVVVGGSTRLDLGGRFSYRPPYRNFHQHVAEHRRRGAAERHPSPRTGSGAGTARSGSYSAAAAAISSWLAVGPVQPPVCAVVVPDGRGRVSTPMHVCDRKSGGAIPRDDSRLRDPWRSNQRCRYRP